MNRPYTKDNYGASYFDNHDAPVGGTHFGGAFSGHRSTSIQQHQHQTHGQTSQQTSPHSSQHNQHRQSPNSGTGSVQTSSTGASQRRILTGDNRPTISAVRVGSRVILPQQSIQEQARHAH